MGNNSLRIEDKYSSVYINGVIIFIACNADNVGTDRRIIDNAVIGTDDSLLIKLADAVGISDEKIVSDTFYESDRGEIIVHL